MRQSSTTFRKNLLWNFRDINEFNPIINPGVVYRTSTLTLIQHEAFFKDTLQETKIGTVIDLRADREIAESMYTKSSLSHFRWVNSPFDPWNQSSEFKNLSHRGSNIEIAYRFFATECKASIRKSVHAILDENDAVAIHCHAGKDRTGFLISLFHLITRANQEVIYADYLASESDTKEEYLKIILDIIEQEGGIDYYLNSCGIMDDDIMSLKHKLGAR